MEPSDKMSENTLPFSSPPYRPTIPIRSFHANIPRDDVDELKTLLRQAVKRPPRETYENTTSKLNLGVTREWMIEMTKYWSERFDWPVVLLAWSGPSQ